MAGPSLHAYSSTKKCRAGSDHSASYAKEITEKIKLEPSAISSTSFLPYVSGGSDLQQRSRCVKSIIELDASNGGKLFTGFVMGNLTFGYTEEQQKDILSTVLVGLSIPFLPNSALFVTKEREREKLFVEIE